MISVLWYTSHWIFLFTKLDLQKKKLFIKHFSLIRAECWGWAQLPGSGSCDKWWLGVSEVEKISSPSGLVVLEGHKMLTRETKAIIVLCQCQSPSAQPCSKQGEDSSFLEAGKDLQIILISGIGSIKNLADYFGRGRQIIQGGFVLS